MFGFSGRTQRGRTGRTYCSTTVVLVQPYAGQLHEYGPCGYGMHARAWLMCR